MRAKKLVALMSLWCGVMHAQSITYNQQVAPIIKSHCLSCHHQSGVAPFALETYEEVCKNSKLLAYVVSNQSMPPWSLDSNEHRFKNERVLTSSEINTIQTWISNAMPPGIGKPVKLKYVAPAGETEKPDLIIKFQKPYEIKAGSKDLLVTYLQRIDLGEDKYLNKIEIVPGNKKALHHCRVDFDTTDIMWTGDVDKDGFIENSQLHEPPNGPTLKFVGTYVPGLGPYEYPRWCGLKMYRKMTAMVGLHYSPQSVDGYDATEVHLFFCKKKPEREVYNCSDLISGKVTRALNMYVPKNEVFCAERTSLPLPYDISLLGIQPHMHLLGKTMNIYAVTPSNDTIQLCKVARWDYSEQENYYYKKLIKIPAGSFFEASACYDNTVNNSQNPFFPPRDVYFYDGMTSENEMIEFYIQFLKYKEGDETRDISEN